MAFSDPIPGAPPSQPTEEEAALIESLKPLVAWDCCPKLSESDLLSLLRETARWKPWSAGTAVVFGDRYAAVPFNGRVYRCVQGGVTGEDQPAWVSRATTARFADGEALWADAGPSVASPYDLRAAAHKAWGRKAAATASEHNFSPGGNQRFEREAIYQHCLTQAKRFRPLTVGGA